MTSSRCWLKSLTAPPETKIRMPKGEGRKKPEPRSPNAEPLLRLERPRVAAPWKPSADGAHDGLGEGSIKPPGRSRPLRSLRPVVPCRVQKPLNTAGLTIANSDLGLRT